MPHPRQRNMISSSIMAVLLGAVIGGFLLAGQARADAVENGLITRPSKYALAETITRFRAAVRAAGWTVFTEIDHAAAAEAVGMKLAPRVVVLFGNPKTGTPAMAAHPLLAIDLPMRVLVWQDDKGAVFVTRSSGDDIATRIFARYGIEQSADARHGADAFFGGLVSKATE